MPLQRRTTPLLPQSLVPGLGELAAIELMRASDSLCHRLPIRDCKLVRGDHAAEEAASASATAHRCREKLARVPPNDDSQSEVHG